MIANYKLVKLKSMYQVMVNKVRPDFRVFVDLLYGFGRNVDTEGNSCPVNSRTWTDLYIKDRESADPPIEIYQRDRNSGLFEVESASAELMELAAIYLFESCGKSMLFNNQPIYDDEKSKLQNKYSLELQRARRSIWHKSSNDNPYPNIS